MPPHTRPFAYRTVTPTALVHTAPKSAAPAMAAVLPLDVPFDTVLGEQRWQEWKAKGRREATVFREKARVFALAGAVIVVLAAVFVVIISG